MNLVTEWPNQPLPKFIVTDVVIHNGGTNELRKKHTRYSIPVMIRTYGMWYVALPINYKMTIIMYSFSACFKSVREISISFLGLY
jgi:hypothetical protein